MYKYLLAFFISSVAAANCGIPPIPPIPPIGTSSCEPVCECDARGQNCHFVFQCE
jgi:hypothetical protein